MRISFITLTVNQEKKNEDVIVEKITRVLDLFLSLKCRLGQVVPACLVTVSPPVKRQFKYFFPDYGGDASVGSWLLLIYTCMCSISRASMHDGADHVIELPSPRHGLISLGVSGEVEVLLFVI